VKSPIGLLKNLGYRSQINIVKEFGGTTYGGWTYCPNNLSQSSIIYSFGIGEDISFDQALLNKFGCSVFAFDPTPKSIQWVNKQNVNENKFHFFPYGIYDFDGELGLFPPSDLSHASYSIIKKEATVESSLFPVKRLTTIVNELNHNHINILKMDIEASEYAVIPTIVEDIRNGLMIDQLLVEFHHRFSGKTKEDTLSMINLLNKVGYKIFNVRNGEEFSFIRSI